MANAILPGLELSIGLLIWCGVLWDGFATIVLPRTVAPMRRVSGRFYIWSWLPWAAVARKIRQAELRLSFLSVYGPLSVVLLLLLWAFLMILAFALIYQGLGPRFQAANGSVGFGTLLYMSASTFLTLGLGDVTSSDGLARLFILFEAGSGYLFLAQIITYMPVLEQAYVSREVANTLIHSRAGCPPSAVKLLQRYTGTGRSDLLRSVLRESERWMAETLQSHLSHPVLSFYRALHRNESWLVSLTTVLDSCALLVASGEGLVAAQAKINYRIGLRLLEDLTHALSISIDPKCGIRLTEADLPNLRAAMVTAGLTLTLGPESSGELLRLVRRYDIYLFALSEWLVIPLPSWTPTIDGYGGADDPEEP
jgi:hypothetical protein